MRYSTSIGIDTHSRKNAVCEIVAQTGEIREAVLSEDPAQLVSWIEGGCFPEPIGCAYETGPTGFDLARALEAAGISCAVAATSRPSYRVDRQKHGRADARWLAQQLAAGGAGVARIPTPEEESLCHLSRLRGEVASDLRRAKQRVSSFLLPAGTKFTLTKKSWSKAFYAWAASYEFAQPADTFTFRCETGAVTGLEERLAEVEAEIMRIVSQSPELAGLMARPACIYGIGRVSAFSLVCEVHDFERFKHERTD